MIPPRRLLSSLRQRWILSCALVLFIASVIAVVAQELSKLPYVPTPQIVVDEMLKMANVTAKDFVIDLGSGDGRMIISAARNFKASGLGVDIDRSLVELSNRQAKAEGVADRVKFVEQDMFKADIAKATVITLYVLPDFMDKLRPKLLAELKPGTRIVAHDYHMKGWYPDRQFTLTVPEKVKANGTDKAYLYLWIVPSIVRGHWRMEFDPGGSARQLIAVEFTQEYQMINASAENLAGPLKTDNFSLRGDQISFDVALGSNSYRFTGQVSDGKMEGNAVTAGGARPVPWRATKVAAKP
jgi:hypothetical protein